MKLTIDQAALEPLTTAARKVSGKLKYELVKLSASGALGQGTLTVEAGDGPVFYRATVEAQVEVGGELLVSSGALGGLVEKLPSRPVSLTQTSKGPLRVSCGPVRSSLKVTSDELMLYAPPVAEDAALVVEAKDLVAALRFVSPIVRLNQKRHGLDGVSLQLLDPPKLRLVSTDGSCLRYHQVPVKVEGHCRPPARALAHGSTLAALSTFAQSVAGEVRIRFDEAGRALAFVCEHASITAVMAAGDFPPYQGILDGALQRDRGTLTFEGKPLSDAIRRFKLALDQKVAHSSTVAFMPVDDDAIEVSCALYDSSISEHSERVAGSSTWKMAGKPLGTNLFFVASLLRDLGNPDQLTLYPGDPLDPIVYREDDAGRLAIIMPVRLD